MNQSLISRTPHYARSAFCALGIGLAGMSATSAIAAPIIAKFADGNSSSQVDAWVGTSGAGWTTAWGSVNNSSGVTVTPTVVSTAPFPGGGNYLQTTVTNTHASATRNGAVGRRYGTTDEIKLNEAHTISFEFRLDTAQADFHRIYFFDSTQRTYSPEEVGNTTTWLIRANPPSGVNTHGSWVVYNGSVDNPISTGVKLFEDHVYRFTIDVSPSAVAAESTYRVKIIDLSDSTNYYNPETGGNFRFFSPQTSVGGFLNFQLGMPAGKQGIYSLDNIMVVPEGSTLALGGFGVAVIAFLSRSGLRRKALQP